MDLVRFHGFEVLGVQEALHHQLQTLRKRMPEHACVGRGRDDGNFPKEVKFRDFRARLNALPDAVEHHVHVLPDDLGPGVGGFSGDEGVHGQLRAPALPWLYQRWKSPAPMPTRLPTSTTWVPPVPGMAR